MVEIAINGRLGNQLFMYAAARAAQLETNSDSIYINTFPAESFGCANSLANYDLPSFVHYINKPFRTLINPLHAPFTTNLMFMKYLKEKYRTDAAQTLKYEIENDKKFSAKGFFPCRTLYRDLQFAGHDYVLLEGYYQSEKFFKMHKDTILRDMTPKFPLLEKNRERFEEIQNTESVCVSLRLGDDYKKNSFYNVCTEKYFKNAIELMKQKLNNPVFYIFSDVTEGLSELFGKGAKMVFEEGNDPDYEKLRIMSACKHFIISNSSFSWWTQYMSTNKDKIVIAPDHWYNGADTSIMMDSWMLLET